ncbi:MAG: hypothetical protein JXR46_06130 [Calditrichaceae bacterium]|nr:hypothetical protein [Calditrichaceae bacterium]MBN2708604.1 hypothetical protein [Calditrichaceae bacterium]RQV95455.1 MAG: hypothetical protein EH224_07495 [Calditrichota bacterium]
MRDFENTLYEAVLVAFGKILSKYNIFSQGTILKEIGKEIIAYIDQHGFEFKEENNLDDLNKLTDLFVRNGFAEKLEIKPADKGHTYIWHNLFGIEAYHRLYEITENPFLSCPLNLCLYYLADKHHKVMTLHEKKFNLKTGITKSQYELLEKENGPENNFNALVIENARLYELAEERAKKLEQAQKEIKTLKGILPICSSCKKIRDEKGEWHQLESYLNKNTHADFSHGYCPECLAKLKALYKNNKKPL